MLYLVALVFSPLAVLLAGKPFQAMLNFVVWVVTLFTVVGLLIPIVHAMLVVSNHYADKRQQRLVGDMARVQWQAQMHAATLQAQMQAEQDRRLAEDARRRADEEEERWIRTRYRSLPSGDTLD